MGARLDSSWDRSGRDADAHLSDGSRGGFARGAGKGTEKLGESDVLVNAKRDIDDECGEEDGAADGVEMVILADGLDRVSDGKGGCVESPDDAEGSAEERFPRVPQKAGRVSAQGFDKRGIGGDIFHNGSVMRNKPMWLTLLTSFLISQHGRRGRDGSTQW